MLTGEEEKRDYWRTDYYAHVRQSEDGTIRGNTGFCCHLQWSGLKQMLEAVSFHFVNNCFYWAVSSIQEQIYNVLKCCLYWIVRRSSGKVKNKIPNAGLVKY